MSELLATEIVNVKAFLSQFKPSFKICLKQPDFEIRLRSTLKDKYRYSIVMLMLQDWKIMAHHPQQYIYSDYCAREGNAPPHMISPSPDFLGKQM